MIGLFCLLEKEKNRMSDVAVFKDGELSKIETMRKFGNSEQLLLIN